MGEERKERGKIKKIKREDGLKLKRITGYTFRDFVQTVSATYKKRTCYKIFRSGSEMDISYSQLGWYSYAVSSYLLKLGLKKGDKIAILGESCPNWMIMYLGMTEIGCVAVPILPDFSAKEINTILDESGACGLCLNVKQYKKLQNLLIDRDLHLFRMEDLVHVAFSEDHAFETSPGFSMKDCKIDREKVEGVSLEEDDVASIIFTSGTTGSSKGVVLTHKNLLRNADLSTDVYIKLKPGKRVLSILPMSHVYEFTIGQILVLLCGLEVTFLSRPPSTSVLLPALSEVRPHVMLTVPLLIEKVYKAAIQPVLEKAKIKALIKNPLTALIVYRTIGRKLKQTFGGCIKFFGIGGAKLDDTVTKFLHKIHFPYALGYGLTETSPLVAGCGSAHRRHRLGYVGEIVIDDDVIILDPNEEGIGEVAVKGVNVMKGYYNNEDLNRVSFTKNGYFKTGDLGIIENGKLALKGRIKEMILGPAGENIYPESIEKLINAENFVEESIVVSDGPSLVALIKIDLELMASSMKINIAAAKDEAVKYINKIKNVVNEQVAAHSKISTVILQEEEFEKTPTQKIKRFLYPKKKERKNDE